ncbi:hypothetical protein PIB30_099704 [Stylosanthes scabra]|uniref:Uncharacterized protein n=1 Tax=Stylosanthes scabra TaxID=79078 RepID=A0ABU6ZVR4_9FABA|nr:hypothetical protein [Stylosanthes scabra]
MTILESQGGENKKKSLALKASNSHIEESDEEEEDQDFAILIKKFTKLQKGEKNKKFKKKQKTYMSWENEDDSSTDSDDDEVENICLMANDEKDWYTYLRILTCLEDIGEPVETVCSFA